MLNINKSLKLKHTGAAGFEKFEPGEMVDFISKGDIKGLTSQMGEGQKFEELGKFNKKFQAKQEDELLGLDPSSGALAEGLKGRGVGDVIPKEGINKENYKSVIKAALKKMDIGSVLKEMHQVLLQGYTKSLEEAGLNKTQIKAKIKEKLKGKGKQKPKGLPMDEILATKFKPWLATRGQMENKMAKTKPFGQLKEMMSFLPKQLQDSVTDIMNIEDITIDKEAIMPKSVRKFAGDLRESLMSVRNRLGDELWKI
jgi:hypothetical protein